MIDLPRSTYYYQPKPAIAALSDHELAQLYGKRRCRVENVGCMWVYAFGGRMDHPNGSPEKSGNEKRPDFSGLSMFWRSGRDSNPRPPA